MESMSEKIGAMGGNSGEPFDDGVFDGVKKIIVGKDLVRVTYIKIEYEKNGEFEVREHGEMAIIGELEEFSVDYPNEYKTSVGGSYDFVFIHGKTLIKSLVFKTSYGRTSPVLGHKTFLGHPAGKEFMLEGKSGGKLLGFHGRSGKAIDAIGAHFFTVNTSLKHFNLQGGNGGRAWDDGVFDGVRKVLVGRGGKFVTYVRFEYAKGDRMVPHAHGKRQDAPQEFVVDYPNEHITSVEGTIDGYLTSLTFKTSKGRTSAVFGNVVGRKFVFEENGFKLVGLCGRSGDAIDALGANFASLPTPVPASAPSFKLPAQGGNGGVSWDDGVHDTVSKVYVGQGDSGVAFVKFEYNKGSKLLAGDGHGKQSMLGTEEFVVDQDDYIISVKVYYEKLFGLETEIITALIFKTYKGITSQPFGMTSGDFYLLEGGKITGFHGRSSDVLHSIGAYISLSPTPMLRGKWIQVEQKSEGPGPRCSHAIAMIGDKMYSFGGERTPNVHIDKDLYVFDFKSHTWSIAPPKGDAPELACLGVCMVAIGTTLYGFGGRDGNRRYNGFYSYDTVKSEWKILTHADKGPAARSFHSMAADEKNIYVFGGVSKTVRLNTLHAYNIDDQKWIELPSPGDSCKPRGGAGLAIVKGKIWVVYGFPGDETDDVHCFDPIERKWAKVETKGEKPWARSVFSTAVVGKYIIVSGGEIAMDPKAHLGPGKLTTGAYVLDTESLMWEKLEEGHTARGWCASTTATIDGKKGLLMYGGKAQSNGRYDDLLFYGVDSA